MLYLAIFSALGIVPGIIFVGRMVVALGILRENASKEKGFSMRNPSLSRAEWQRWNGEYFRWRVLRVPLILTLAEGLLLSLALRIPGRMLELWLFIAIWQLLPLMTVYITHLWLLYQYGRFNLERFDRGQHAAQQIATLTFYLAAWIPLPATYFFIRWIVLAQ